ncbi:MAG: hypothetical protein ACKPJJ_31205 [Planctomycetaceae bacterium]
MSLKVLEADGLPGDFERCQDDITESLALIEFQAMLWWQRGAWGNDLELAWLQRSNVGQAFQRVCCREECNTTGDGSTISSSVTAMAYPGSHAGWCEAGGVATFALPAAEVGAVAAGLVVCLLLAGTGTGAEASAVAGIRTGGLSASAGPSASAGAGPSPGEPSSVAFSD